MSTQQAESLDEGLIAQYLQRHPDFFCRQRELLAKLRIPHDVRPARSLIEYQVQVLRDETARLRAHLDELLRFARSNDRLMQQLHRLTLELLEADSLDSVFDALRQSLRQSFHADAVEVILITVLPAQVNASVWSPDHPDALRLTELFGDDRPVCGRLDEEHRQLAFGKLAAEVKSAALIPLADGPARGMLAIGSRNPEHYRPDQGTVFLRQLGALLGRAIQRHLRVSQA